MKEQILEAFKALGFEMEDFDGTTYGFYYEGRGYLLLSNEDDDEFLSIALPCVKEMDGIDEFAFYQMMDKMNSTMKYIKVNKAFDSMTLSYERELFGDEDLEKIIRRMILRLEAALFYLHNELTSSEEGESNDDSDNDETTEGDDEDNVA